MITFKQYLEEARLAPLYHGTPYDSALLILNSGYLKPSESHTKRSLLLVPPSVTSSGYASGISMSRSYKVSARWAADGIVLVFDQQKLNTRYRIIPFFKKPERKHNTFNQQEEYVLTDKNIPLQGYLIDVLPSAWPTPQTAELIEKFKAKYNLQ